MRNNAHHFGFTLLELSIVLVVLGVLTGMAAVATLGTIEATKRAATEKKLDEIEKALYAFRIANKRLPCPGDLTLASSDTNYGMEASQTFPMASAAEYLSTVSYNCVGGAVSANYTSSVLSPIQYAGGAVPVRSLNLPDDFIYDGWGRKFTYNVDAFSTIPNAFSIIRPSDSCNISVNDAAAQTRTDGAIYTLISSGANGHGGFIEGTTRNNAGVTNVDELTNCHCDSTGAMDLSVAADLGLSSFTYYIWPYPAFVQKGNSGDAGDVAAFDDVVRYKSLWQLQDYEDQYNFSYIGPRVVVKNSTGIQLLSARCGNLFVETNLNSYTTYAQLLFTPGNKHIFTYTSTGPACALYKISGTSTSSVASPVDICPAGGGGTGAEDYNVMVGSKNGYIVLPIAASPYITLWKLSGDHLYNITNPIYPVPSGKPKKVSITADGVYLALSDETTANTKIYVKNASDQYIEMGQVGAPVGSAQPTVPTNPAGIALSPDGKYLAIGDTRTDTDVKLWKINSGAFDDGAVADVTSHTANATKIMKFSPDSRTLGIAVGSNLYLYSINNDVFTVASTLRWINSWGASITIRDFSFSADSSYVIVAHTGSLFVLTQYEPGKWGQYGYSFGLNVGDYAKVVVSH